MRSFRRSLLCAVAFVAWSPVANAERQTAVGPGQIPLNANGVLNGVDMSGSATTGTLVVGVVGGPATDIFSSNQPVRVGQIAVTTAASSQGNIVFNSGSTVYGAIGETQPAGPFVLAVTGGNTGTSVNFVGPVFATTTTVSGSGSINFASGSTNVTATSFAADGTISLAPNTTVIGALTTTAGASTGSLVLGGGSVLDGAVGGAIGLRSINLAGGNNSAGVTSTISGAVDAFSFALGTNTLNIGGALTIANAGSGGVINTTLASPSVYGNIRPVGATNLGSTLLINVTVAPDAYIPVGSTFNIVQTQPGTVQSGTDGSVVGIKVQNPTNPLYTFSAVPLAGTIAGMITIQATGIPLQVAIAPPAGVALPPVLPVAAVVAPVLLAIAPTTDVAGVLASINAISTPGAVITAVAQLAPSVTDAAAPLVALQGTKQLQNLWLARLDSVSCDTAKKHDSADRYETQACPRFERHGGLWGQGFGYFASQNNQRAVEGYDASTGGAMLGWDAPIGQSTYAGAALGYAGSTIRGNKRAARTDVDSYQVSAYIGHEPGPWFMNAAASVAANDYSGVRQIAFSGVNRDARASFSGQAYTGFLTAGWHMHEGGFTITPLASIQYTRVSVDAYRETGAGDVSLNVKSRSYDFVESAVGVKIERELRVAGGLVVPEVHGKWFRELKNPALYQEASFAVPGSQSFAVSGIRTADDLWNAGAGLSFASCACSGLKMSFEAGYDFYATSAGYSAHQGTIKLRARF